MALSDTNLVVRYYFDQAASGTAETQINDVSGNAYHLTEVNYGSGNMAWTEVSGNRGLESTATTGTQRAWRGINNTSDVLRDAIVGAQKCTVEIVVRVDAITTNNSRIFVINNRVGGNPLLGFSSNDSAYISGLVNDSDIPETPGYVTAPVTLGTRYVLHLVLDTTLTAGAYRLKMYRDGSLVGYSDSIFSQNETLTLPADIDLSAFNRENSGSFERSFDGVLFYAAIYDDAFDATRVSDHYDVLTADDDEPSGEPPAEAPSRTATLNYLHLLVR